MMMMMMMMMIAVVLPWLAKDVCIVVIIDVAPTISIDVIAITIMIPLIMWFIIIYTDSCIISNIKTISINMSFSR